MNTVQPIRDKAKIQQVKDELLKTGIRNYMMFVIGINTGLRVGDLLRLKVSDVKDKPHILIREKKTGKAKRFLINSNLKAEIDSYISDIGLTDDDYLFASQKGINKPLTRVQRFCTAFTDWLQALLSISKHISIVIITISSDFFAVLINREQPVPFIIVIRCKTDGSAC